jgi:hypothetical protein
MDHILKEWGFDEEMVAVFWRTNTALGCAMLVLFAIVGLLIVLDKYSARVHHAIQEDASMRKDEARRISEAKERARKRNMREMAEMIEEVRNEKILERGERGERGEREEFGDNNNKEGGEEGGGGGGEESKKNN